MLVEGSFLRSISRVADVPVNSVSTLLGKAGAAFESFQDATVRGVKSKRVRCGVM
jgi:hypothetical protein